jgi:hypothetical protein
VWSLFHTTDSVLKYSLVVRTFDDLEIRWKTEIIASSSYYPGIFLDSLRNTTKKNFI